MRGWKVLFWLAQLAGAVATVWLLWGTEISLGVAREWTWDRIEFGKDVLQETKFAAVIAGITTVVYLLFCLFADHRVLEANRWEMAFWLGALTLIGATWHGVVQECPPEPHRLSKVPWVVWFPGTQGYYQIARFEATDRKQYLAGYAERMNEGDVLHFGTHPPGFILLHKSIIDFVGRSPKVHAWLLAYQPDSVREGWKVLAENSAGSPKAVTDLDRAALWLSGLLAAVAAMSTVVPLFCLLRRTCGRETAWRVVCFWPLIPALAVFHPASDLWLPFCSTLFLATWGRAWSHRSWFFGLLAGGVMFGGMLLSLAMLPVAFLAALWTLADFLLAESADPLAKRARQLLVGVVAAVGTFVALTFLTRWLYSLDLLSVWQQNYRNHAAFYEKYAQSYPRTYSKWLLVNPLELAFAAGAPVFVMAVSTWLSSTHGCLKSGRSLASFRLWCFVTLVVLWLSGKNSGEAARLWIFLLPWLLWVAAREQQVAAKIVVGPGQTLPEYAGSPAKGWITLLILQAVVCIATVSRVDGFKFQSTVPVAETPATVQK
jgi:hypothetical protein